MGSQRTHKGQEDLALGSHPRWKKVKSEETTMTRPRNSDARQSRKKILQLMTEGAARTF